jgi:hypothetical protein
MVLHLSHPEGGFGLTFNDITKDAAFYPLVLLRDIHNSLLVKDFSVFWRMDAWVGYMVLIRLELSGLELG